MKTVDEVIEEIERRIASFNHTIDGIERSGMSRNLEHYSKLDPMYRCKELCELLDWITAPDANGGE